MHTFEERAKELECAMIGVNIKHESEVKQDIISAYYMEKAQ